MVLPPFGALLLAAPILGADPPFAAPDTQIVIIASDAVEWLDREAMAFAYTGRRSDMAKAATWHAYVVAARPADDPERFDCLRTHAELLKAIGNLDGARAHLEEAARLAESKDRIYDAAMTYIDVALLAVEAEDMWGARRFAWRARVLSGSPRLTEAQQQEILQRLDPEPLRASLQLIGDERPVPRP